MIEVPQSFVVREECEKAAWQHGFRRQLGVNDGWAAFGSTTAQGKILLAASGAQGPWFLALEHAGVIAELGFAGIDVPGPGHARYAFNNLGQLYATLSRVYELAVSLPDAPLRAFETKVARTTSDDRGRTADHSEDRSGPISQPTYGLLAGPLPADWDYGSGFAACLAHHPLERMRERRRAARRAQWSPVVGSLGRGLRPRACDFR
ncbi:hypothetical protein ABH988_007572 [Bradyrhizobium ottawaense]